MIDFFSKLKDNRIFQFSVVVIIILNAILIGATTYKLDPIFLNTIHLLDYAITVFFVIEILIRFIGEKEKKNFLKDGWNVFDTIIVAISLIPIPNNSSEFTNLITEDFFLLFITIDSNPVAPE